MTDGLIILGAWFLNTLCEMIYVLACQNACRISDVVSYQVYIYLSPLYVPANDFSPALNLLRRTKLEMSASTSSSDWPRNGTMLKGW